ncbi:MAG: hypothetical protein ABJF05_12880 [Paracoccaceae bacterium]
MDRYPGADTIKFEGEPELIRDLIVLDRSRIGAALRLPRNREVPFRTDHAKVT